MTAQGDKLTAYLGSFLEALVLTGTNFLLRSWIGRSFPRRAGLSLF